MTVATRWPWWCRTLKSENLAICSQVSLWQNEASLVQLRVPTTVFRTKCRCCHRCMRQTSLSNTSGTIVEPRHPSSANRCSQDFQHWKTSVASKAITNTILTNWSWTTRPGINRTWRGSLEIYKACSNRTPHALQSSCRHQTIWWTKTLTRKATRTT